MPHLHFPPRRVICPIRILMVTDGFLDFGIGGFGLSEFVTIIKSVGHAVSTSHRQGSGPNLTIPGNFKFTQASVTIAQYDQIWLFGADSDANAIDSSEQNAIAAFMQAGGGVFATGDHETLGQGMGANIPRVRTMRNWSTIPMSSVNRLDTVVNPGQDMAKQFQDESDSFPQYINPVLFPNGFVHPVLLYPNGAVNCLPDHPHESECFAATAVAGNFAGVVEWPEPGIGGTPRGAEIAAFSLSGGGPIVLNDGTIAKPAVIPRTFGAISVYDDGNAAGVGRIVCDATWHHFLNINLNGSGALPNNTGQLRTGLYNAAGLPTPEYLKIQRYYLNTVRWLAPNRPRWCWVFEWIVHIRFYYEIVELRLPPHPCPWDPLIRIGLIAEEVVTKQWGVGALAEIVDEMLRITESTPALARLLQGQYAQGGDQEKSTEPSLLPLHNMRRAILGSVVNLLAHKLPANEEKLEALLKEKHEEFARDIISEGINGAEQAINDYLQRALKQTTILAKAIQARK